MEFLPLDIEFPGAPSNQELWELIGNKEVDEPGTTSGTKVVTRLFW